MRNVLPALLLTLVAWAGRVDGQTVVVPPPVIVPAAVEEVPVVRVPSARSAVQVVHPLGGVAAARIMNYSGRLTPGVRLTRMGQLAAYWDDIENGTYSGPYDSLVPALAAPREVAYGRMRVYEYDVAPVVAVRPLAPIVPVAPARPKEGVRPASDSVKPLAAPTSLSLELTHKEGRTFDDAAGNRWALIYGTADAADKAKLDGWLMPHASGTSHFYARNGNVYMAVAKKK